MADVEKGGSPRGELSSHRNTHWERAQERGEDHGLEGRRGNPFADCIAGEKPPYSFQVFDRVHEKLILMMGDYPKQNWYWTRLDPEERNDMHMVYIGFSTVAGGRLGQMRQTELKSELYSQATGEGIFPQYPFTPHERFYGDRFELTYRQAQVVQKIMHYLDVDYNPGGEENTPENLARRTFYYDDVLARPITPEHPGQPIAKSQTERNIAKYLQSKKK